MHVHPGVRFRPSWEPCSTTARSIYKDGVKVGGKQCQSFALCPLRFDTTGTVITITVSFLYQHKKAAAHQAPTMRSLPFKMPSFFSSLKSCFCLQASPPSTPTTSLPTHSISISQNLHSDLPWNSQLYAEDNVSESPSFLRAFEKRHTFLEQEDDMALDSGVSYTAFASGPEGKSFVEKQVELPRLSRNDGNTTRLALQLFIFIVVRKEMAHFMSTLLVFSGIKIVAVVIICCGVCYTDTMCAAQQEDKVVGHEVIGRVEFKGEGVSNVNIGDIVGLGYIRSTCLQCSFCLSGHENMCPDRKTFADGVGGFANASVWDSRFVYKIPETIEPRHAGPLTCAGAAVFAALYGYNVSPASTVGVVGIGGLGHLAIKFAKAWGCKGELW